MPAHHGLKLTQASRRWWIGRRRCRLQHAKKIKAHTASAPAKSTYLRVSILSEKSALSMVINKTRMQRKEKGSEQCSRFRNMKCFAVPITCNSTPWSNTRYKSPAERKVSKQQRKKKWATGRVSPRMQRSAYTSGMLRIRDQFIEKISHCQDVDKAVLRLQAVTNSHSILCFGTPHYPPQNPRQ